jgi:hypothetical protein
MRSAHGRKRLTERRACVKKKVPDTFLKTGPNDFRKISSLDFAANSGNGDGRQSGFNDRGQIAFAAFFMDGSSGVFVSDVVAVPEPGGYALLAALVLSVVRRIERRPDKGRFLISS